MTSAMTSTRGMRRVEVRDSKLRRVKVRERKPRCVVVRGRRVGRVISGTEPLNGVWGRV